MQGRHTMCRPSFFYAPQQNPPHVEALPLHAEALLLQLKALLLPFHQKNHYFLLFLALRRCSGEQARSPF